MKAHFTSIAVLLFVSGTALACPNFSGKYQKVGEENPETVTIAQSGCASMTWTNSSDNTPYTIPLDGSVFDRRDSGSDHVTAKAYWDGSKIISLVEWRNDSVSQYNGLVQSITDEYTLLENGNVSVVESTVDHLFNQDQTTRYSYQRVQ